MIGSGKSRFLVIKRNPNATSHVQSSPFEIMLFSAQSAEYGHTKWYRRHLKVDSPHRLNAFERNKTNVDIITGIHKKRFTGIKTGIITGIKETRINVYITMK